MRAQLPFTSALTLALRVCLPACAFDLGGWGAGCTTQHAAQQVQEDFHGGGGAPKPRKFTESKPLTTGTKLSITNLDLGVTEQDIHVRRRLTMPRPAATDATPLVVCPHVQDLFAEVGALKSYKLFEGTGEAYVRVQLRCPPCCAAPQRG
jgi:hypothetical protein